MTDDGGVLLCSLEDLARLSPTRRNRARFHSPSQPAASGSLLPAKRRARKPIVKSNDAEWDRIYREKFEDPYYYSGLRVPYPQSAL